MKPILFPKPSHNVVIPSWIMTVGLVSLSGPPLSVPMSLAVLVVGVLVVPSLLLMPGGLVTPDEVVA